MKKLKNKDFVKVYSNINECEFFAKVTTGKVQLDEDMYTSPVLEYVYSASNEYIPERFCLDINYILVENYGHISLKVYKLLHPEEFI